MQSLKARSLGEYVRGVPLGRRVFIRYTTVIILVTIHMFEIQLLQFLNFWLPLAGLGMCGAALVLLYDYFRQDGFLYRRFVASYVWFLVTALTAGSVVLSLVYSEYLGFIPCSLCWLQRIAVYPQALMVLIAWKGGDHAAFPRYGIGLSVFGLVVALYQYVYQMLPKEVLTSGVVPCLADGTADCAAKVIDAYGFVTFPLMSAFTFVLLIALYLHMLREAKRVVK